MKTLKLTFILQQRTLPNKSVNNLTDGETFNLLDASNLIFVTYTVLDWLAGYIGSVVFIGSNILYASVIGILVQSHIGTSLKFSVMTNNADSSQT